MRYVLKVMLCVSIFGSSTYTMQPQTTMNLMNAIAPGFLQTIGIGAASGVLPPIIGGVFSSISSGQLKSEYIPSTLLGAMAGGTLGVTFHLFFSMYSTGSISLGTARSFTTIFGLLAGCATLFKK
jgi:hypothetical protein